MYLDLYAAATAGEALADDLRAAFDRANIPLLVQRVVLDVPAPSRGVTAADAITLFRGLDGSWEIDRDLQFVTVPKPDIATMFGLGRLVTQRA